MPLDKDQRRAIQNILSVLSELRMKMAEAQQTATRLGISFRELERQSEIAYDDLRAIISETRRPAKKRPKRIAAGDRP